MEPKICIYGYIYSEKTNKGWKITKMNGGKKIALMRIAEAVEDWADQW